MSLKERFDPAERSLYGPGAEKSLTHALIAAARQPMAVLDRSFRVTAANRSYYQLFPASALTAPGRPFCEPRASNWSTFVLQTLSDVVDCNLLADDIEVDIDVP